jgi:GNAT superfamily N-acetyltransferase
MSRKANVVATHIRSEDLPDAHALSHAAGWPHRFADWEFMFKLGRGFVVRDEGNLIGTAMWWPYGTDHGSVGMVVVSPNAQRRGIGSLLMESVLEDAGTRTLHLNSTDAGVSLYRQLGFEPIGGVRQMQGSFAAKDTGDGRARLVRPADRVRVASIDRQAKGFARGPLIEELLGMASGVIDDSADPDTGFGFIRNFGRGELVGPIISTSQDGAEKLVDSLMRRAKAFVRIDCDAECVGLSNWLQACGLVDCGVVTTMLRGRLVTPGRPLHQYAVVSQALG